MSDNPDIPLVPGRSCGECNACCDVPTIDTADLIKKPGVLCRHWRGGCSIYEKRPGTCREFFCGWRLIPLPEDWRPDRLKVLLIMGTDVAADGRQDGVRIHLFGPHNRILWAPLVNFIQYMLNQNVPVFLSVSGEPGEVAARVPLSDSQNLRNAFASGDPQQIAAVLMDCVAICVEHPKEQVVFENKPPEE